MALNVKYCGYFDSYSGMSQAARNYVHALHLSGVPVTTENLPNLVAQQELGEAHKTCHLLLGRDIDYKIKIIHTTPDIVTKYMEPMKYHIFHLFWETNRLPDWWVWALNLMDEVWTGSNWSKEVFIKSGVKKPIFVFPQAVEPPPENNRPYLIKNAPEYFFYSIFQWIERKNPKALLTAFWKEFSGDDRVALLIKSYKENFTAEETAQIRREAQAWKVSLHLPHYPKVYLCDRELDKDSIWRFHQTGDCFVSAHRGEGWGIPIAEALKLGKPVISTQLGGVNEFIPKGSALMLKYTWVPVFNMDFVPWYNEKQQWAEVDELDLRQKMRAVFEKRQAAEDMAKRGKQFADNDLSYLAVGTALKERLQTIYEEHHL